MFLFAVFNITLKAKLNPVTVFWLLELCNKLFYIKTAAKSFLKHFSAIVHGLFKHVRFNISSKGLTVVGPYVVV